MNLWFQALEILDCAQKQQTLKMINTEQVSHTELIQIQRAKNKASTKSPITHAYSFEMIEHFLKGLPQLSIVHSHAVPFEIFPE